MRKRTHPFILFTIPALLIIFASKSVFAYLSVADFLCEQAVEYYQYGNYADALQEFNKVLLIDDQGESAEIARKYIKIINGQLTSGDSEPAESGGEEYLNSGEHLPPGEEDRETVIRRTLEKFAHKQSGVVETGDGNDEEAVETPVIFPQEIAAPVSPKKPFAGKTVQKTLVLNNELTVIELEMNQSFVVQGREIVRWLATSPESVSIEKKDLDHLTIFAQKIGQSYVHVWDQNGRWTLNIKVIPSLYIQELIKEQREKIVQAEPFKVRYSFNRSSFHQGESLRSTERQSLSMDHWAEVTGETPYGDFDSAALVNRLKETTDLTQFTIGLSDASVGRLKDFNIRGGDYNIGLSALSLPDETLRGVTFDQELVNDRWKYTTFWGSEGGGKFGNLSPGLEDVKDSFILGGQFEFLPSDSLRCKLASVYGYGDDRDEYLKDNVIDLGIDWQLREGISLAGELGYDSEYLGLLLGSEITMPTLKINTQFRNLDENFLTITGRPAHSGELGGSIEVNYVPFNWLNIYCDGDVYQDRLFPNLDEPDRLNYNFNTSSYISLDPTTALRLEYQYIDEQGKLSPRLAHSSGIGVTKRFAELRDLGLYVDYRYRDSENPHSPTMDYNSDSLAAGLSLRVLSNLYCYVSRELSWLTEEYAGEKSNPVVIQAGIEYSQRLFSLPVYTKLRINYRNEDAAASVHSFLSGEDSIEYFGELTYRPRDDFELFLSSRFKDIWADSAAAESRSEIEVRAGGRLFWDTGFSWNPTGSVTGVVYNDYNDDGRKQSDEPGIENVQVSIADEQKLTDRNGYYSFTHVNGKKARVAIDSASLPEGFVLSSPDVQEVEITHHDIARVDFGIVSRSEIQGVVFEDVDADGKFGVNDIGVGKVRLLLENGSAASTDNKGQYYFRKLSVGKHKVTLDLSSLALEYLPCVPLTKEITLYEGISYIYNVPLQRVK
ncbi:MAG: SdrD B-like domain-containing protein [Candidatus Omnitrophota bacterium]